MAAPDCFVAKLRAMSALDFSEVKLLAMTEIKVQP